MTEHLDRELILWQNNRQNDRERFSFATERTVATNLVFPTTGPCDWPTKPAPLATGSEATLGLENETVVQ